MIRTLSEARENRRLLYDIYFKMECPECHEWFVFDSLEVMEHTVLYDPKEEEYEAFAMGEGKLTPCTGKEMVSSDVSKDLITLTCPICGKQHTFERKEYKEKRIKCNAFGEEDCAIFDIRGEVYKRAKAFREKHQHKEGFEAQGKMGFSTLGQQFSYIFTPGGLGNGVTIKCNYCGETEDITDFENW